MEVLSIGRFWMFDLFFLFVEGVGGFSGGEMFFLFVNFYGLIMFYEF